VTKAKSYTISKQLVWDAYKRVKANRGAAGVDGQSLKTFEKDLKNNLYKVWNRMCSGSYFPPPVRVVEIPKGGGGTRPLGIPTVADRVAQMVAKRCLEPLVEPHFHPDSYGYRPGKSALDAVGATRQRCWRKDWVVDLDIKGFFDNLDHGLVMRAVRHHTDTPWLLLYIERWLAAPAQKDDGTLEERTKGTPQGGVISPLLANLFMHYAFDAWLTRAFPHIQFARYADDVIIHAASLRQSQYVLEAIRRRLKECGLGRGSRTARTTIEGVITRALSSTSSDTPFNRGGPRIAGGSSS
jgi:group II intron reverse transcriptase/maturase